MSADEEKIDIIKQYVKSYPDFPKPGVLFRDIFSILNNPDIFLMLRDVIFNHVNTLNPTCVVGVDSRGFLLGPLIALELKIPFIPIRKQGKLPGKVFSQSYSLEYGDAVLEIQRDHLKTTDQVLIVDDLLATGGTLGASCDLIRKFGATVIECLVLMELIDLNGATKIDAKVYSFIKY